MFLIDQILLIGGLLALIAIWSSKISARFGVPVLFICLAIGMAAGSEGVGGIEFEDYSLAHAVGTVSLAVILFDGGLRTSLATVRQSWRQAGLLATLGVFLTALITGLAASFLIGLSLLEGLLFGAIVSSTDAAAVFLILKKQGLNLKARLSATLELESGSNDPMAVFLTIGLIEALAGTLTSTSSMLGFFLLQMGVGATVGIGLGLIGARVINGIDLDTPGLYPLLAGSVGFLSFGLAANFQGSGFLAVYLTGILLGRGEVVFRRGIYMFFDGAAWMAQLSMFIVLGLLVTPSSVLSSAGEGIALSLVLLFLARPLALLCCLAPFRFSLRELSLLVWAGLKGAVPIVLAIYPLLFGIENARQIFDIVFFVVLMSALVQGWSLPSVARKLKLDEGSLPEPYATLEITSLRHLDAEIVEYSIQTFSPVCGHRLADIPLPYGVIVALVAREKQALSPGASTVLNAGDYVFVVSRTEQRALMDRVFGGAQKVDSLIPSYRDFPFKAGITLAQLSKFYHIDLPEGQEKSLEQLLQENLEHPICAADFFHLGNWIVGAKSVEDGEVLLAYLAFQGESSSEQLLPEPLREVPARPEEGEERESSDADCN